MRDHLTEAEFDELKKCRDKGISEMLTKIAEQEGVNPSEILFTVSGGGNQTCYCNCPSGPCQHVWTGPWQEYCGIGSVTCARCGQSTTEHSFRTSE
jgi:hypothetical protein